MILNWSLLFLNVWYKNITFVMKRIRKQIYVQERWPRCLRVKTLMPVDTYMHQWTRPPSVNTLRLRQNGHHFADDIFEMHILGWKCMNFDYNYKNYVPKGAINNIPVLVQIMTWHWPGNKPLSETMMVRLLTHICITRTQWVKVVNITTNDEQYSIGLPETSFSDN